MCILYMATHTTHSTLLDISLSFENETLKKLTCPEIVTRLNTLAVNIQLYLQIVC